MNVSVMKGTKMTIIEISESALIEGMERYYNMIVNSNTELEIKQAKPYFDIINKQIDNISLSHMGEIRAASLIRSISSAKRMKAREFGSFSVLL